MEQGRKVVDHSGGDWAIFNPDLGVPLQVIASTYTVKQFAIVSSSEIKTISPQGNKNEGFNAHSFSAQN